MKKNPIAKQLRDKRYKLKIVKPKNKPIMISRNILKAQKILENVCNGQFPGQYSDH